MIQLYRVAIGIPLTVSAGAVLRIRQVGVQRRGHLPDQPDRHPGHAVAHPFLPAAPDKRQCDLCEFRVVCGPYEERRVKMKPVTRLAQLKKLRGMP